MQKFMKNKEFKLLPGREFFAHESEIWTRTADGEIRQLRIEDADLLREFCEAIRTFYPKAYTALAEEYGASAKHPCYMRFRIASRFIRCNFAELDNVPDVSKTLKFNFEYVKCPMRGECRLENIVCRPQFEHRISPAEMPVMEMWFAGASIDEIAEHLCLSGYTVNNHICHVYTRLGVHSKTEFIHFAEAANLFAQ